MMTYQSINNEKVILWTIQPLTTYEELLQKGEVAVFESELASADPKHLYAYEWLIDQMKERIEESPYPKQYPIWAWFQYRNIKQNRPDMRTYRLPNKEKNVRLTLEMNRKDVLLSDLILWENVAFHQIPVIGDSDFLRNIPYEDLPYLGYSDSPFLELSEKHQNIIKSTWPNIFNLNIGDSWHTKRIQATFWTLKLSDVKKVEYFTGI